MTIRLLGLGDNTVDTYVDAATQYPGGNAVNVAAMARRRGVESSYLGAVGSDEAGALIEAALADEGVDLSRLRRRDGPNARALIGHTDGDRRFLGSRAGVRAQIGLGPEDYGYVAQHALTHTSIYSEIDSALPELRRAAPLLSFDFSERWTEPYLDRTLRFLDIAFLSAPGRSDSECEALLRSCTARGAGLAVVTRGEAGAVGFDGSALHRQGIVPATVVDTLGAGDGFITAFLVSRLRGGDLPAALRAGAEFAAEVCGWHGGFGHGAPWSGEGREITGRAATRADA
ncbi:PfkB family carbohydrate kinase [Roseomonas elaeocarpi]|uniref:PfkB family carbohydrate kinase n=1 Tax=Roseomonas elaeocarpi TaxID=907779 RepID=A0ABV6JVG4_9PROT